MTLTWFFFSFEEQLIGSLQKKYSIGSFELLTKTTPMQALSLLFLSPFIDFYLTGKLLSNYKFSSGAFVSQADASYVLSLEFHLQHI